MFMALCVCVCLCASVCCGMVRKEELKSNSSSGSKYTSDNIIRRMNIVVVQSMT